MDRNQHNYKELYQLQLSKLKQVEISIHERSALIGWLEAKLKTRTEMQKEAVSPPPDYKVSA